MGLSEIKMILYIKENNCCGKRGVWGGIFAHYMSDSWLMSGIQEELPKLNTRKNFQLIHKFLSWTVFKRKVTTGS